HANDVPENLLQLCDHASDQQQAGEKCEREYKQFLEEVGLDADTVNNRGIEVVEEES
ncbi:ribonuclease R, partial [Halobacteriales archaeon QS_7_68_65]